ncbi:mechanosensitive ion channel family protein [Streptomyces liangshanensis]|uniref:Mechanosensitive ion channel family protein n=1 Tax=Streptomyces liangshanensis TaxID=2717324 RepID=A0A6G9H0V7_9ACTN|nr:mechanosensitive ion channel family protein [Streptomyces liangshanensis]QIQ03946.1 mechanosensitive ion channel family protein [Streptomyces liangshanensis]
MNRALTWHDLLIAGAAVVVGLGAGLLLRLALRWLGERATRTRWGGDDIIVGALRLIAPWGAFALAASAGAAALPLTPTVGHNVNQTLVALLILAATFAAARVIADLVQSVTLSRSAVAGSATIFVNITRVTVLAIGVLVLLQTLGISIAPLLTALGVGGLAVALAMQDTLANLFAGVHILVSKTVQPGDYIRLSSGEDGYVVDINWRNTVVRQLSDNLVIIPNSKLASTIMTNYHRPEQQMSLLIQVAVGYGSDLDQVERVTKEVAGKIMSEVAGGVPDHEPLVRFHTFTEAGIGFTVILRALEFGDQYLIKHEFIKALYGRYRADGIEIPVPGRTVVIRRAEDTAALAEDTAALAEDAAAIPRQRREHAPTRQEQKG